MKQIAAILLTLIVCFNTVGYFFVFKIKEQQIKSDIKKIIKSSVPEEQLVVIRLTPENKNSFTWIHSREFRYNESMFDVVKYEVVTADITDYFCIEDKKEAGLFRHLNSLVKEMMKGNHQTTKVNSLFSVFFAGLFPPLPDKVEIIQVENPVIFDFTDILYSYLHFSLIPHPPKS